MSQPADVLELADWLLTESERARARYGSSWRTVHIFHPGHPGDTYCRRPGRYMTHHEIRRHRITCIPCLRAFMRLEAPRNPEGREVARRQHEERNPAGQ